MSDFVGEGQSRNLRGDPGAVVDEGHDAGVEAFVDHPLVLCVLLPSLTQTTTRSLNV